MMIIYPCDLTMCGECPKVCQDCAHCQPRVFLEEDEGEGEEDE